MASVRHLSADATPEQIITSIEADGVAIVDDFVSEGWLSDFNQAVKTNIDEYEPYDYGEPEANEFLGYQTVRLNGLIAKAPNYVNLIVDNRLLAVMDHFLAPNCGQYILNSSEVIEIHPGETAQELHIDDVIWPVSQWVPDKLLQFNVMIAGSDYTEANGATRVVPGSHRWNDPTREAKPDEICVAEMKAGSAVFVSGKTIHGGGANVSDSPRRAIVVSYLLGWLRTQENHFLHVDLETAAKLPERARQLLGYELYSHYDDQIAGGPLGYYEYGCPSTLFS